MRVTTLVLASRRWLSSLRTASLWWSLAAALPAAAVAQSLELQKLWSGTWVMTEETTNERYIDCCEGKAEHIPLTPKFRKIRDDFAAIPFATQAKTVGNLPKCISPGSPGLMTHPVFFEFLWSPTHVAMVFQEGSFRRFYTDGRGFPEPLNLTYQGTSIARWEGETLVVETRGISSKAEMMLSNDIKSSRYTRVLERFTVKREKIKSRLIEADKYLLVQTTVEDPEVFTAPYSYDMKFVVVPIPFETGCAYNNRDDGTSFDLTPPEDD